MAIAERLNTLDDDALQAALVNCCAARKWVERMAAARPFATDAEVLAAAAQIWWELDRDDWLEAFAGHPKIGDVEALRSRFAETRAWASDEQSGVAGAGDEVLRELARLNGTYEERFGYIFIVCATGKSAAEMLALLQERLPHEADAELRIAAGEQLKITEIRLRKLASNP